MEKVRVAIIGMGQIAKMAHLAEYAKRDDVEIVGFVDAELARVEQFARSFARDSGRPEPHVYASLEDLLVNDQVDAVSVCTPNTTHAHYALQVLEHGLHLLVEKPMTVSLADAQRLQEAAEKSDRVAMVGLSHRFRDDVTAIKRFVDAGDLGQVYYAKTRILRRRGTPKGWFTHRQVSGGGPLMDIGVHALDLAWWLMGQPQVKTVSGFLTQGIGNDNVDFIGTWTPLSTGNERNQVFDTEDFAAAFIRFTNGSVLQLEVAWEVNGPQDDALKVELFGTKGGISLDPLAFYGTSHGILTTVHSEVGMGPWFQREIDHFMECVKTGQHPLSDVRQGRDVVQMLEMIVRSSQEGRELTTHDLIN